MVGWFGVTRFALRDLPSAIRHSRLNYIAQRVIYVKMKKKFV